MNNYQLSSTEELIANLIAALRYYANGHHLILADPGSWDTVSGEPQNFLCDEAGTATVEDGALAKLALRGSIIDWKAGDEEGTEPGAIDHEVPIADMLAGSSAGRESLVGWYLQDKHGNRVMWCEFQFHFPQTQWRHIKQPDGFKQRLADTVAPEDAPHSWVPCYSHMPPKAPESGSDAPGLP